MNEELKSALAEMKEGFESKSKEQIQSEIKAFEEKNKEAIEAEKKATKEAFEKEFTELKEKFDSDLKVVQDHADKLDMKLQKSGKKEQETKSFNQVLKETIEDNYEELKNLKPNSGTVNLEMKAVGDMSTAANFSAATQLYQDQRPLMIEPYGNPFLGDILPPGSSNGTQLTVPKENGGEGGIDVWSGTGDKSQVDYDFTTQTVPFKWIAGWVIVGREMLDDVAWLTSYLQQRLLLDLKKRENAFILNEATTGMLAQATAYDGSFTEKVERVIDAGFGQIVDGTDGGYSPSTLVMRGRDAVNIGLNKASGSGEFDLPNGSLSFNNGRLDIGGMQNITTTSIAADNFLVFDKNATQFVKRLQPELRVFEDAALAKQNKIMFRIEERAALAVYNSKALVTGTLSSGV